LARRSWAKVKDAAKKNALLAVPSLLYAVNNYLKFVMQLYFRPATVKMLSNLKAGRGSAGGWGRGNFDQDLVSHV